MAHDTGHPSHHQVEIDAFRWLIGAGGLALLFALSLVWIDNSLTYSKREERLGDTLRELRGAQSGLVARPIDPRLEPEMPSAVDGETHHDAGTARGFTVSGARKGVEAYRATFPQLESEHAKHPPAGSHSVRH